jgi:hypothetical protein
MTRFAAVVPDVADIEMLPMSSSLTNAAKVSRGTFVALGM